MHESRLFFALWPTEALRTEIESAAKTTLVRSTPRWIPPENYHITLLFLGSVARDRLPLVTSIAARQHSSMFDLTLDRVERWRSTMVFVATEIPPALAQLVAGLRRDFSQDGFVVEEREYRPHVTFARDVEEEPPSLMPAPLAWAAENFALVESQLEQGGSVYRTLATWPLMGRR
jgi:RNA 2',3'-cyclic 3'-phosphodiesterase